MEYKRYTITVKKEGKRYRAKGVNGVYEDSSMGEDEKDAIRHLKNKIDMAEAYIKGDSLIKKYTFNRPYVATLNGRKITVYSLDFVQKVFNNDLEPKYEFVFRTDDEDIFTYYKVNIRINNPMTFKVYPNLEVLLHMDFKSTFEIKDSDKKMFDIKCVVLNTELIKY